MKTSTEEYVNKLFDYSSEKTEATVVEEYDPEHDKKKKPAKSRSPSPRNVNRITAAWVYTAGSPGNCKPVLNTGPPRGGTSIQTGVL